MECRSWTRRSPRETIHQVLGVNTGGGETIHQVLGVNTGGGETIHQVLGVNTGAHPRFSYFAIFSNFYLHKYKKIPFPMYILG